jgi:hypothetical protein
MEIILIIICIIGSIIIFKNKDKRFPNYPILGWLVCTIILAVGLYLMYFAYNGVADKAAYNAGYESVYHK